MTSRLADNPEGRVGSETTLRGLERPAGCGHDPESCCLAQHRKLRAAGERTPIPECDHLPILCCLAAYRTRRRAMVADPVDELPPAFPKTPPTPHELDVFVAVVNAGYGGVPVVAKQRGISVQTVKNIVGLVTRKVGGKNRPHAAAILYPWIGHRFEVDRLHQRATWPEVDRRREQRRRGRPI